MTIQDSAKSGPFGLTMGMSLEDLNLQIDDGFLNFNYIANVPRPHPDFEMYVLKIVPGVGLSSIHAKSAEKISDVFGESLRVTFINFLRRLERIYGEADLADYLMEGSIWNEPADFMDALQRGERRLHATWESKSGHQLPHNLSFIMLNPRVDEDSRDKYCLNISYNFSNNDEAESIIESMVDDVL